MRRNIGVGVKTVHHVEIRRQSRSHLRQVGGTATADDQHVDVVFEVLDVGGGIHRRLRLDGCRIPTGEDPNQFHIVVLVDSGLHPSAEVAVAVDSNFQVDQILSEKGNYSSSSNFILR